MPKRRLNGPLKLLAYLLTQEGEVTIFKIRTDTNLNINTIYTAVGLLKEVGFIKEEVREGPPMRRLISLTEKGRRAAECARVILELAGEA